MKITKQQTILLLLLQCAFLVGCAASGKAEDIRAGDESTVMQDETIQEKQFAESESQNTLAESSESSTAVTWGTQTVKGFVNDNALHSEIGDIHFSSYIPETYDGTSPYALFITLPGWEGLYFQGVGANMVEDFGLEAVKYNDEMIILSPQLDDWGKTSAEMTILLTEYFLENYNIAPSYVYLEGFSGGGETGSIVMGMRPELYTAYLMVSSKWDGDLGVLADAKTPVYMVVGEEDSYYGSAPLKDAYETLYGLYEGQGLSEDEISRLLVLDVKDQTWFSERGIADQHGGGGAFAYENSIMGWLFGEHDIKKTFDK